MGHSFLRSCRLLAATAITVCATVTTVALTGGVASAEPFTYAGVSAGYHAACAVTTEGTGVCWGWNYQRSLGTADTSEKVATPSTVTLPNGERFASIDAGQYFTTCGVSTTGNAYCWGQHHTGNYFNPTSLTPVRVELPAGTRVTHLTNGSAVACAITTVKELWCWGDVANFGNGSTEATRTPERVPMPDGSTVEYVDAGPDNTCAITGAQHLYCWGANDDGEIGLGYLTQRVSLPESPRLPAGVVARTVSVGLNRICALDTTGTGWCWGDNYEGAFGNDTYADSSLPVRVLAPGGVPLSELSTAWYHTCATLVSGTTHCWGRGGFGELGTGTTLGGKTFRTPVVPDGVRFVTVATGLATSCAIDTSGRIWCWTGSSWGVAGTGDLTMSLFPRLIAPIGSPTVGAPSVSDIAAETAAVRAVVTPNGSPARLVAEVATEPTFTSPVRFAPSATITTGLYSPGTVTFRMGSLAPRTAHWVRVIATNEWGSVTSATATFTTIGSEPSISVPALSSVTATRADITFSVDPGLLLTTGRVEVSTVPDFTGARSVTWASIGATQGMTQRSVTLSGLPPRTTHFVRIVATNRLGTTTSDATRFETLGSPPVVSGVSATASLSSVTVSARVDGGLLPGTVRAELSTDISGANLRVSTATSIEEGANPEVTFLFPSLDPRTDYWVRVVASNELGSSTSVLIPVRTRGGTAVITAITAGAVTVDSATVSATIDATGLPTMTKLQVATDAAFTTDLEEHFVGRLSNDGPATRSVGLAGLDRRTTYFTRFVATNAAGTTVSDTVEFTTPAPVGIELNNGDESTVDTTVTVSLTHPSGAVAFRIADNPSMKSARVFDRVDSIAWNLVPSTDAETERTVYVQFLFESGQKSAVYSDSITLVVPDDAEPVDETAPEVTAARVMKVTSASVRPAAAGVRVMITGTDSFSGITSIQVRAGGKMRSTPVSATRRLSSVIVSPARTGIWVRLVDAAGNKSRWTKVRAG